MNKTYVSLDIGSTSIKVIAGEVHNEQVNITGVGDVKSSGIRKGSVIDIEATVQSIRQAVEQAQRMKGGDSISEVIVGIPATQVGLQGVTGRIAVKTPGGEVTNDDIDRVKESAQLSSIPPNRELINLVPIQYKLDNDASEIIDPRGMLGNILEMDATLITTSKTTLHNVLRCVEKAGLDITQIYLQPLAAGYFALTEDEKNLGTAYIDIGGGSTTISIFEEGHFTHATMIPIGGDTITKDLSYVLKTSTEQAEMIKIDYGHAFFDEASEDEVFSVAVAGAEIKEQFSQRYISEIIEARVKELFDLIISELYQMGIQSLPGGIVLSGGVAKLEGIEQLAREVMDANRVRTYYPDYIGVREPEYTSGVSLIRYAQKEDENYVYQEMKSSPQLAVPKQKEKMSKEKQPRSEESNYNDYEEYEKGPQKESITKKIKKLFSQLMD